MKPSEMPRPFAPEHSDADDEADSLANQLHGTVKPMNADEKIAAKLQEQADELSRLTGQVKRLAKKNRMLEAGNRVKDEFLRTRQCPDHSGKWERGRCLQCEVEKLEAENKKLKEFRGKPAGRAIAALVLTEQRADQLQAKLDAVRGLQVRKYHLMGFAGSIDCVLFSDLQQALNAPETA